MTLAQGWHRVRLTLIATHRQRHPMRTPFVEGVTAARLEVGRNFWVQAESIDPDEDVRLMTTSVVQEINGRLFRTDNSVYRLEYL